jgi:hypothetical protein
VYVSVTYKGGFNPLPDDIVLATTVMAARMYKERQSGYSDVIATDADGTAQYRRAMPADVYALIQEWKRWTA